MTATMTSPNIQALRALDPDLPFLASEAAVDLDNLLSHRARNLDAIRRLADRLNHSIEASRTGATRSLMDPATLNLLGVAMAQTRTYPSEKVEDVLSQTAKIASRLATVETTQDTTELEQDRDFCVALSEAAASYRRSIQDLRPQHPFRR